MKNFSIFSKQGRPYLSPLAVVRGQGDGCQTNKSGGEGFASIMRRFFFRGWQGPFLTEDREHEAIDLYRSRRRFVALRNPWLPNLGPLPPADAAALAPRPRIAQGGLK